MEKNISRVSTSTISIALIFPLFFAACSSESKENNKQNNQTTTEESHPEKQKNASVIADTKYSDGTPIQYVVIGSQVWTANNLRVTKFADGTTIGNGQSDNDWKQAHKKRSPAFCYAGGDPASAHNHHGLLYNGYAVTSEHGLCPNGWHVPTPEDIEKLLTFVGSEPGKKLKATYSWNSSDFGSGNGTDEKGLGIVGSGARNEKGRFDAGSNKGNIATSYSSGEELDAYQFGYIGTDVKKFQTPMATGLSCRCVKDNPSTKELDKANQVIPQPKVELSEEFEEDEIAD